MRGMKSAIGGLLRAGLCAGYGALDAARLYRCSAPPVAYVTERADWSIRWDARYYAGAIEARHPGTIAVTSRPQGLIDRVVHFGSQFHWALWEGAMPASNRYVVTYFHGKPEDGPEMARHVAYFLGHLGRLARVVTAASAVERRLLGWGVPSEKLTRVPLGVECTLFREPSAEERRRARRRFGVPEDAVCIGSFQKDGIGWGEGMEPKPIKGPDVLVEALARLARDLPAFALLTGPARGYVRRGLETQGVPYHHVFLGDYREVVDCYHALDLYMVTSREEGGPKALLESMACGVPVVSTRTGMAEDVIADGHNGALAAVDDLDAIVAGVGRVLSAPERAAAWRRAGRRTALSHDWSVIAEALYDGVYRDLLP